MCWCQGGELNSRPRAYESPALPLSYPGKRVCGFFVASIGLFGSVAFGKDRLCRVMNRNLSATPKMIRLENFAPGGGRTHNLRLRRPSLYPIELRVLNGFIILHDRRKIKRKSPHAWGRISIAKKCGISHYPAPYEKQPYCLRRRPSRP